MCGPSCAECVVPVIQDVWYQLCGMSATMFAGCIVQVVYGTCCERCMVPVVQDVQQNFVSLMSLKTQKKSYHIAGP